MNPLRTDSAAVPAFLEDRVDGRLTVGDSMEPCFRTTRTRGAVYRDVTEWHISDPDPEPTLGIGAWSEREKWVMEIGSVMAREAAVSGKGRRGAQWNVVISSFIQRIWVRTDDDRLTEDVRKGCRAQINVSMGGRVQASAQKDMSLAAGVEKSIPSAFEDAFLRAEIKLGGTRRASPGDAVAVFAPGTAGIIVHELIGHALEGDVLADAKSWLGHGPLPASTRSLTVIDDPRIGRAAWSIDDEGTPASSVTLVDAGHRTGQLLDRVTAATLGLAPTGHGRRASYTDALHPRMGCTYIDRGPDDPNEIVRQTSSGLFIRRMATGHTDPMTGLASFVVDDADRIVDGRIAEPLEPFIIEIDGRHSWASIDRVGHDLEFDRCIGSCVRDGQPLAVSVGAPTIRIGVVKVHS